MAIFLHKYDFHPFPKIRAERRQILYLSRMNIVRIILIAGAVLWSTLSKASDTLVWNETRTFAVMGLENHVAWAPESAQISPGNVTTAPENAFKYTKSPFVFSNAYGPVWLKWTICNESDRIRRLFVEPLSAYIYRADIQVLSEHNGVFQLQRDSAVMEPQFKQMISRSRHFKLHVEVEPQTCATVFLRLQPHTIPLYFDLQIWDEDKRKVFEQREYIILGSFLGFNLIFIFILALALINTKLRYQWNFLLFTFFGILFIAIDTGAALQFIWPHAPDNQYRWILLTVNLYLVFGMLYIRGHFYTRENFKTIDVIFKAITAAAVALSPFSLALAAQPSAFAFWILRLHCGLYILCAFCIIVVTSYIFYRTRKAEYVWFMGGFTLHGLSMVATNLQYLGIGIPDTVNTLLVQAGYPPFSFHIRAGFLIGVVVEIAVIFFISINRYKTAQEEKERALRELAAQKEDNFNALVISIENERRRIAQDLHDQFGVMLSAIQMQLAVLSEKTDDEATQKQLSKIVADVSEANRDLRNISHKLMPGSLSKSGLKAAVEELISRIQAGNPGLVIYFYTNVDAGRFNEKARLHLFRIIQEGLNNMVRHAGATEASVQLLQHNGEVLLTLEDNGQGFDQLEKRSGIGLSNMKRRTLILNGKLNIDSTPGRGTTVSVAVPKAELF